VFRICVFVLGMIVPVAAQAFTHCTTQQIAGPGAHVAEEASNPVIYGSHVYAGYTLHNQVGVAASADWGKTLNKPVIVATGAGPASQLRLGASGPNVYALWNGRTADGLHMMFAASHNYGSAWDSPLDFGIKRTATLAQISEDGANVHIAYLTNDGRVTVRSSHDGGRTFSAPLALGLAGAEIVITSFGANVYLAWGLTDTKSEVIFAVSHDGGTTFHWSNLTTSRPSGANEPILSLDRVSGRLSIVWRENKPWQGVYVQSLDHGATWSAPLIIDAHGTRQYMVVDDGTYIYVTYLKVFYISPALDWQIYYAVSNDGGKSFSKGINLTGPTGVSRLDNDDERPIPWIVDGNGAFRLTGMEADGVHAWMGRNGNVFAPVLLGPGFLAAPAWNSAVWEGPNQTVMYGFCQ
jgi:hypothetical protein